MYPEFAKITHDEGFEVIAKTWKTIAVAKKQHETRYRGPAQECCSRNSFQEMQENRLEMPQLWILT